LLYGKISLDTVAESGWVLLDKVANSQEGVEDYDISASKPVQVDD